MLNSFFEKRESSMRILVFKLMFFISINALSAVWESDKEWDASWQNAYSNWVATQVGPRYFKDHSSRPFRELRMDCADAHYGLMAYFARENGLHFRINRGNTTNRTDRFDHIQNADQRLAAFIRYLGGSFGTESLVHADTYPIAVTDIQPGDLFMYKIGSEPNVTRHAYIIKNINVDGTFDVMYSTQARMAQGLPLNRRESYVFTKAPLNGGNDRNHWGFRRPKPSAVAHISQENLSISDFSQYALAQELGRRGFNQRVVELNRSISESPNRFAQRSFSGLCQSIQNRVEIVALGLRRQRELGGACMNYRDYDAHSTPSRDSSLKDEYLNYFEGLQGKQSELNREQNSLYAAVFARGTTSTNEHYTYARCPVDTAIGAVFLNPFKTALFDGDVSFHPNDTIEWRWGRGRGSRTRCTEYYGYPVD
jgi:hypothetical protein